jgi:DNA-binding Lrp family transcriptional regulator
MSVTAYILIQADVGTAVDVARSTAALDSVITAEVAMGPYDVIARAQAETMDELGQVVHAVQGIPGVERTLLCPIINI